MKKALLLVASIVALAGCATEPVRTAAATPVPPNRILASNLTKARDGYGSVILKRDTGWNNVACTFRLYANGIAVADIDTSEKVQIYLAPGEHIIGSRANGICAAGNAESSVTLSPGQTRTYRISVGSGGELKLQPTAY